MADVQLTFIERIPNFSADGKTLDLTESTITLSMKVIDVPAQVGAPTLTLGPSFTDILVSWSYTPTVSISGFKVYRKPASGVYSLVTTVANSVFSFDDTGLTSGITYTYRIDAYNDSFQVAGVEASISLPLFLRVASDGSGSYLTIAAALVAAPATGGAIISVKDGTYDGEFSIDKEKIQLIGDTRAGVIVQSPLSAGHGFTITANDVTIKTITLDGRRAAGATGDGISVSGDRCHITDCLIKNTYAQGIIVTSADNGEIDNCNVENLAINSTVRVDGHFAAGIQIIPGNYWSIHDNYVTGWAQAIGLWNGCSHCTVNNNDCVDNVGFENDVSPRSAIEDYGAGVTPHEYNTISNNTIDGTTGACIESAQGTSHGTYSTNTMSRWGIFNANGCTPFLAVGDVAQPNHHCLFSYNVVNCDIDHDAAILIAGANTVIDHNDFNGPMKLGSNFLLTLYDAQCVACEITYNTFDGFNGGMISFGANVPAGQLVDHNTITGIVTGGYVGIYLAGGNASITNNTITGVTGTSTAIQLAAGADDSLIDANTINGTVGNSRTLIYLASATNTVTNNILTSSNDALTGAIRMTGAACLTNDVEYNTITCTNAARSILIDTLADYNTVIHNTINNGGTIFLQGAGDNNVITPNP